MNGKGSKPRPLSVSRDEFAANWERIFGKKPAPKRRKARQLTVDRPPGEVLLLPPQIDLPWSHIMVNGKPERMRAEEKSKNC